MQSSILQKEHLQLKINENVWYKYKN